MTPHGYLSVAHLTPFQRDDLGALISLEMGKIRTEGEGEVQEFVDIVSCTRPSNHGTCTHRKSGRLWCWLVQDDERPSRRV